MAAYVSDVGIRIRRIVMSRQKNNLWFLNPFTNLKIPHLTWSLNYPRANFRPFDNPL